MRRLEFILFNIFIHMVEQNMGAYSNILYKCSPDVAQIQWTVPKNLRSSLGRPSVPVSPSLNYEDSIFTFKLMERRPTCDNTFTVKFSLELENGTKVSFTPNGQTRYMNALGKRIFFHPRTFCLSSVSESHVGVTMCRSTCSIDKTKNLGSQICIPKCCPIGEVLVLDTGNCEPREDSGKSVLMGGLLDGTGWEPIIYYKPKYLRCNRSSIGAHQKLIDETELAELMLQPDLWTSPLRFCVDHTSDRRPEGVAILSCISLGPQRCSTAVSVITIFVLILSGLLHAVTPIVHTLVKNYRSTYGSTVMAFACTQLTFFGAASVAWITNDWIHGPNMHLLCFCSVSVIFLHFCFLSTYTWMFVLVYDIWRKLSVSGMSHPSEVRQKFRCYCIFGFGVPLPIIMAAILEFYARNPIAVFTDFCKFYTKESSEFLLIPTLPLYTSTVTLMGLTLRRLWVAKRKRLALESMRSKGKGSPQFRGRLKTIVRLMVLMGTFLIVDVSLELWDAGTSHQYHCIRMLLLALYRSAHASAQIWIFVCNGNVPRLLVLKYPCARHVFGAPAEEETTNVESTDRRNVVQIKASSSGASRPGRLSSAVVRTED